MRGRHPVFMLVVSLSALFLVTYPALAQSRSAQGKLHITVSPKQAYVFVDGNAIRDGSQTIELSAGEHEIEVANYGYQPNIRQATIVAGKTSDLNVTLEKTGEKVAGPFGDIEFKGHPRAAVLLNGTTPAYFVGHVDEFDNNWIWHQWLLVKPGTYAITVTRKGNTIWSGPVTVKAGERVLVNLNHNGETKTYAFKPGLKMGPRTRFEAGIASARVDVAPVSAELSASQAQESCGGTATLDWKTANAVDETISNIGAVAPSGDESVSPTKTTTYELTAKGPGGEATRSVTIGVNAEPTAMLSLSTPEITYRKVGDKVVEQDSATLQWSTSNGNRVTISPLGTVGSTGSETIEATPGSRDVTYTLQVANACGGTVTRTATLHIAGSIEPAPAVTLASVFYPTNYPLHGHPRVGLLPSQKKVLAQAAATFKKHEEYSQPNQLVVVGHADVRGPEKYNTALSERRAELVKDYLVSQGIPADVITVRAEGKDQELDQKQVQKLQAEDPEPAPAWMMKREKSTWLAYNRRVDIIREPAGQLSTEAFPNDAAGARILWERPQPSLKAVQAATARNSVAAEESASSGLNEK
jgi:OmpA family/PEGA domain